MPPRDPEATKARIFTAATAEFAAYGIAGARVDRIARNANANKQLIYAYFGDKEQLFHQVLDNALSDVAAAVSIDIEDVGTWIDQHLDYYQAHPEYLRLLKWESLELSLEEMPAGEKRVARYAAKMSKIAQAQDRGLIRADLTPGQVLVVLLSMVNYLEVYPQASWFILGADKGGEQMRATIKEAARRAVAP